ncbi:MFS transporter [Sphingobium estronivorans]|uniref:MFS transporter n=1 Tax=Sphingobium estronivorans TaxID=1577690 RepID=UPI00123BDFD9|nr:MFS transporter [Sphingobium estronivorans]
MQTRSNREDSDSGAPLGPLRERTFRNIWSASIFSNLGQLMFGVAAAWEMTRLSHSPTMVAMIQTAMMLPIVAVTLPAGALADMLDRRKVAMAGLGFSALAVSVLAAIAILGATTSWLLLAFCAMVGIGTALFSPSWQASIPEQVSRPNLTAAIALSSISYNIARSFGPALGGIVIVLSGAKAVFVLTAGCYLPLLAAFFCWKRNQIPSRLPPERIDRAIQSGMRYALHSPGIRAVLVCTLLFGFGANATILAMAPLIVKDLLSGNAITLGVLLGSQGAGAIAGATMVSRIRTRFETEAAIRIAAVVAGLSLMVIGFSHSTALTVAAFFIFGIVYIITAALLNVSLQLSVPRWVVARTLSLFTCAMTAGIAAGATVWGMIAAAHGVGIAIILSGVFSILTCGAGYFLALPGNMEEVQAPAKLTHEPDVGMPLTMRSGPIVIEAEYDVDPEQARAFYEIMMKLRRARQQIGAFNWSVARDIANPAIWTERYQCPTWGDYLHMRDRYSGAEIELQLQANAFHRGGTRKATRRLERPYGSVRWKADSLDSKQELLPYFSPTGSV